MSGIANTNKAQIQSLKNLQLFADKDEFKDLFKQFCQSALSHKCTWKEGSAGNLLFFSQKLKELLIVGAKINNSKKGHNLKSHPFTKWEVDLENWTLAALSDHSIVEYIDPSEILMFFEGMNSLIESAYI